MSKAIMRILCQNITIVCLVCAGLVMVSAQVDAADIMVDAKCNLADAIRSANWDTEVRECRAGSGPDTIHLTEHVTLTESLPPIRSQVTIEGDGHTLSGDNQFRIFHVAQGGLFTINRLTVIDAYAEFGGAIVIDKWTVATIKASVFAGNRAGGGDLSYGGAIYVREGGTLDVDSSRFIDNSALDGGAIYNDGYSGIQDSTFTGNVATGEQYSTGGAVVNRGDSDIFHSTFDNNVAGSYAGAISNFGDLGIIGGKFSGNSAGSAGALANSGDVGIVDAEFLNNSATALDGGAIFNSSGTILMFNSTVSGNSATRFGGGMLVRDGSVTADGMTIDKNTAEHGGGLYVYADIDILGRLSLRNSHVANNSGGDCIVDGLLMENLNNTIQDGGCLERPKAILALEALVDRLITAFDTQAGETGDS